MSTSSPSRGVPFAISPVQQNLRLVELPPELLDVLTSPDPPKLHFKAPSSGTPSDPRPSSGLGIKKAAAAENLHLYSPTQSYEVRQISTSNSVYVLAPSSSLSSSSSATHGVDANGERRPGAAMSAIAKVDTMLELLPVRHDAREMLMQALPLYDEADDAVSEDEALSSFESNSLHATRLALFADTPVPDSELADAWQEVIAFELRGRCARAGSRTSLNAWKAVVEYGALNGLNLAKELNMEDFFRGESVRSPIAAAVAEAILVHVSPGTLPHGSSRALRIDRQKAVSWTGNTLLHVSCMGSGSDIGAAKGVSKADFLARWQDLLPEAWRGDVALEKLPTHSYSVMVGGDDSDDVISPRELQLQLQPDNNRIMTADASTSATTTGKRKWHEKFKGQRKEVKK